MSEIDQLYLAIARVGFWLLGLLGGSFVIYCILRAIYRLTLHPLAKYPGPLFSKISDWSLVYQTTTGDRHQNHMSPIVRIAPNTLSVNTITALREIYASRKANVQKSEWYRIIDAPAGAFSTHSEIDREKHAFRRRVLDHAFSDVAIRSAEGFVLDNIRVWCKQLGTWKQHGGEKQDEWSEEKNMGIWSTYLNYDIMGDLAFGKRFNCLESTEHRFMPKMLESASGFVYPFAHLPYARYFAPLLDSPVMGLIGGQMARDLTKYIKYSEDRLKERIEVEKAAQESGQKSRQDFLHYLLQSRDPETGRGFTEAELLADTTLLIAAGGDTTSTALSAAFFYLLHNPVVLSRAAAEVRSSFSNVEEIRSGPQLNSLTYLRAVIEETLRRSPPVTTHIPREVLAGGIEIDGHVFPHGTVVGTSAYAIHHNAAYFPDPFSFRPERWIVDPDDDNASHGGISSAEQVATARAAFCAFSLGSRGCIGKRLAYLELTLTLARLLFLYDIRQPAVTTAIAGGACAATRTGGGDPENPAVKWPRRKAPDEYQLQDVFLARRDGPTVEFRARLGSSSE